MTNEEFIQSITLPGEEWRDVPGWEGLYAFSSEGRIASLRTEFYYKNRTKPRRVEPFIMRGTKNATTNGGYATLSATLHKKVEIFYVHRLVASAFVFNPNPEVFTEVDHIDGDTMNNKASNLRWVNRSANMMNPITRQRQAGSHIGKTLEYCWKPVVRLSNEGQIKEYKNLSSVKNDGFTPSAVSSCCSGKRPYHKGFRWMYLSDYEPQVSMSKNSNS